MMLIDVLKRAYPDMLKCKVMSLEYDSLNEERFTPKPHNLPWWCRDIIWHYFGRRLPGHLSVFEMAMVEWPFFKSQFFQRKLEKIPKFFTKGTCS